MENYNSLSVIYAIHMKMNDRSQSRVSNFNVYNEADNRVRDKKKNKREREKTKERNFDGKKLILFL